MPWFFPTYGILIIFMRTHLKPARRNPSQLDLTTEVYATVDKSKCVGCGKCIVSCNDAAAQAIHFEEGSNEIESIQLLSGAW